MLMQKTVYTTLAMRLSFFYEVFKTNLYKKTDNANDHEPDSKWPLKSLVEKMRKAKFMRKTMLKFSLAPFVIILPTYFTNKPLHTTFHLFPSPICNFFCIQIFVITRKANFSIYLERNSFESFVQQCKVAESNRWKS